MSLAYTGVDNLEVMAEARNYARFLNDSVADAIGPPSVGHPILDFGAGTGTHCLDLRARGYDVRCVELDPSLCSRLTELGFGAVRDVADLPGDATFRGVYTMNVLEHIEDHATAMNGLAAVLESKGRLVVYVPAMPVLFTAMDRKVGHVRRYRRNELVGLAVAAGLVIERCEYVDSLGVAATLLYRLVGSRRGDIGTSTVGTYDRYVFSLSRRLDRVTSRWFGKNLLLVASKR